MLYSNTVKQNRELFHGELDSPSSPPENQNASSKRLAFCLNGALILIMMKTRSPHIHLGKLRKILTLIRRNATPLNYKLLW